ncbi:MAG: carbohydrate ABC transporter permease [Anaerolineaceae bacterium]|mgnify:CR=1|jgi:raffinose/stachyose/melibiose transport system permease protein|nr:carbohydrate ABC transporter permease [Anaerolineaceae bacterium]MDD4041882.1 carbohydrate ABC transporter permease [Anaerolineaceae bacterium]MDD4577720.1 carbohydrate ABC transporter permease [Anaerolineaceae bacterium]
MSIRWKRLLPRYLVLIVFMLIVLLPIWGMLMSAFKTDTQIASSPFTLPETLTLENFKQAWTVGKFNIFFKNSVIVTTAVVISSVFLSTLSGYAFGQLPMPGKNLLFPLMLLGYMVPFEAVIIPLYNWMDALGLRNTYLALILPQIGLSVSFGTLWMSTFFENAPRELVDAATIDGCNRWQTLWLILWPLAQPATTTLIVLIFMWTWNEFLLALVMVQTEAMRTLPVGLAFFQGKYTSNLSLMAAGAIIVALPTVLIYVIFQRFFIRGMLGGAIKG